VSAAHMVEHSLIAGLVAPLLVLGLGSLSRRLWHPAPWSGAELAPPRVLVGHPLWAWSAFVVAQWVFHLSPLLEASHGAPVLHAAEHLVFLAVGVWFWLPVLGAGGGAHERRLGEPERALYLFLAAPAVDLVGVALMVRGDGAAGVAMLAGTLPIVAAAAIVTWQWLAREHRQATAMERAHGAL
jgi:cytochrome c oxidase assembly factor CtaG